MYPLNHPRSFVMVRDKDHTGISGVGQVAQGVVFADGTVALRWHGEHSSTVIWTSIEDALAIHGHNGDTRVIYTNAEDDPINPFVLQGIIAAEHT